MRRWSSTMLREFAKALPLRLATIPESRSACAESLAASLRASSVMRDASALLTA
jgi:hypothetical protein